MSISLHPTVERDLQAILELEANPDVAPWISAWPLARHLQAIVSVDEAHLSFRDTDCRFAGFLLLAGLRERHGTVELRRIVLADRGAGFGATALDLSLDQAFGTIGANRVWLDVLPGNARALSLYRRLAFTRDGELREAHLLPDGSSTTLWFMSISRTEWAARRKPPAVS